MYSMYIHLSRLVSITVKVNNVLVISYAGYLLLWFRPCSSHVLENDDGMFVFEFILIRTFQLNLIKAHP